MSEVPPPKRRRRCVSDSPCRDVQTTSLRDGMITSHNNDADYAYPRCRHGRMKEHCSKCLSQCEHGRGKVGCPTCNRCVHNQHKRLCRYCNNWTCQVDGCRYKGHHFCSKSALKNHTQSWCPTRPIVPPILPGFQRLQETEIPKIDPESGYVYSEEDLAELEWERDFWLEVKARERAYDGPVVKQSRR